MKSYPDIIMLALPRWDGPFSSTAYSMAKELSKQTRVFYIDNPFTLKDLFFGLSSKGIVQRLPALLLGKRITRQISNEAKNLIAVTPLVTIPINFLRPGVLYRWLNKLNNWIVKRSIVKVLENFKIDNYIFINSYNPFFLCDIKSLRPMLSVYHCVDNIAESKYIKKHGVYLEKEMMEAYDLTIVTSRKLKKYACGLGVSTYLIPNAADFNLFASTNLIRPDDLPETSGKIIGYIGSVDHRLDYRLLERIANHFADAILLLVGPSSKEFADSGLGKKPNVIAIGKRDIQELPGYLLGMDCAIIPFVCNELTSCIYPLKLNEYLAAGKPVVTTPFSEDLIDFKSVVEISDADNFIGRIEYVLDQNEKSIVEERKKAASVNTWENRIESFWELVQKV